MDYLHLFIIFSLNKCKEKIKHVLNMILLSIFSIINQSLLNVSTTEFPEREVKHFKKLDDWDVFRAH